MVETIKYCYFFLKKNLRDKFQHEYGIVWGFKTNKRATMWLNCVLYNKLREHFYITTVYIISYHSWKARPSVNTLFHFREIFLLKVSINSRAFIYFQHLHPSRRERKEESLKVNSFIIFLQKHFILKPWNFAWQNAVVCINETDIRIISIKFFVRNHLASWTAAIYIFFCRDSTLKLDW